MEADQQIRVEELPAIYQAIAKIIGMENTLRLGKELGGEQIYLPKIGHQFPPFLRVRDYNIAKEYNGHNVKALARKHDLTTRSIHAIVKQQREKASERQ